MALFVGLCLAIVEPLCFWGSFAGDAELHLVFGESASHGRPYEFNPGERVSGETSAGYMLLTATLFRAMRARWVPVALKLLNLVAWYGLGFFVYRVATHVLQVPPGSHAAGFAALIGALIGGSLYNANVGMENGLFALVFWAWLDCACRWGWFRGTDDPQNCSSQACEWALSLSLAASAWIRPEGIVVFGICNLYRRSVLGNRSRRWLLPFLAGLVVLFTPLLFQFAYTGDLVATSILSRKLLAASGTIHIGRIRLDPRFAERLLFYTPITAYFCVHVRRRWTSAVHAERLLWLLFAIFFVGYTTLTGAAHVGRYVIFLMPIVAIGAAGAASAEWQSSERWRHWVVSAAAVLFLATNVAELAYRYRSYSQDLTSEAMGAPEQRALRTEEILEDLDRPSRTPVTLALEPVQVRYSVDDRLIIRSVDGRTDRRLFAHARDGAIDYVRYFRDSDVQYFFMPPGAELGSWAARLAGLQPGESVTTNGMHIERLRSGAFEILDRGSRANPP